MNYSLGIKELRNTLIITQEELAKILGVSFASVNRWENKKSIPTTKVRRKLNALCLKNNIHIDWEGTENE
ncbi:MAG: helix-turn-helix transcriptional regulator [Bacilli bacterium]